LITGYNTDIRHGNKVFHVQTEDKGLGNPKIETLIYVGGEILDSHRSGYEDILASGQAIEPLIQSRMDEQHKAIIRDIKTGKYDPTPAEGQEGSPFTERPLEHAILEFLQAEGEVDTLELVMEAPLKPMFYANFKVHVQARLCHSHQPVQGADISVKLLSSLKKTSILLSGKTDAQGWFNGELQLPPAQPGNCALVVGCLADQGFDELKAPVVEKP